MLKYRIITAIILIPIFLLLVLYLPPVGFCYFTGAVVLLGAWEWSYFMGAKKFLHSLIYPFVMALILLGALRWPIVNTLYVAVAWWVVAFFLVALYPRASAIWSKSITIRAFMGAFVLVPCWLAINYIRNAENGVFTLLFLFALIWGADIGAYFVGKKWGKTKLAPFVSPGKSVQGLIGALVVTILIALSALYLLGLPYIIWLPIVALSLITVLFSVLGDLFESMMKRNVDLKDSSGLLPGHGGILDRIDSLTAAAPVFAVCAVLLVKFLH